MAMNFHHRLRRLERGFTPKVCPACKGNGKPGMIAVYSEDDKTMPRGCERCGRVSAVKRIILLPMDGYPVTGRRSP